MNIEIRLVLRSAWYLQSNLILTDRNHQDGYDKLLKEKCVDIEPEPKQPIF